MMTTYMVDFAAHRVRPGRFYPRAHCPSVVLAQGVVGREPRRAVKHASRGLASDCRVQRSLSRATVHLTVIFHIALLSGMSGHGEGRLLSPSKQLHFEEKQAHMTSTDQERWRRVKERLRSELGDDVFTSWFGRMELDAVEHGLVRLSVPTRFLRNWIQSHYSERVLAKWQEEEPDITRLELSVRSATIRLPSSQAEAARAGAAVARMRAMASASAANRAPACRSCRCTKRSAARRSIRA